MPLSWNEIRRGAIAFMSLEWQGETREAAGRQSFGNGFFNVFGVRRLSDSPPIIFWQLS